jgi:hypothetical protein
VKKKMKKSWEYPEDEMCRKRTKGIREMSVQEEGCKFWEELIAIIP